MYFNETKLIAWARAAQYIEVLSVYKTLTAYVLIIASKAACMHFCLYICWQETMSEVRDDVYCHFEDEKHALATKVIGKYNWQNNKHIFMQSWTISE